MLAHILIHNPRNAPGPGGMMDIRAGRTAKFDWSVGRKFSIAPGDRLFFYRSKEPRGIFGVGVALPFDDPDLLESRESVPVPVKPGLAVYEAPNWRGDGKESALYVNAEWEMMSDPDEGRFLIPYDRLRNERPFSRIFTRVVKGQVQGNAPQASGSPVTNADIADALYAACAKEFPLVLREYGDTPLHIAVYKNDARAIAELLGSEANPNARDKHGNAPMHWAMTAEAAAMLSKAGADARARNESRGATPMHFAANRNACEAVGELAKLGADIDAKDHEGLTPMHTAAMDNAEKAIAKLAELGADVMVRDNAGGTPMHFAADRNAYEAIEKLAKLGADVNSRDGNGRTPLDDAEAGQMKEAADLLRKLGGKRGTES